MDTFEKKDALIQLMLLEYLLIRLILQLMLTVKELEQIRSTLTEKESANAEDNLDIVNAMRHHYWF